LHWNIFTISVAMPAVLGGAKPISNRKSAIAFTVPVAITATPLSQSTPFATPFATAA
jgi:hypothetical protein